MLNFNPNWTNADIYDRVGNSFIDWVAQGSKDYRDWQESLSEVAKEAHLTKQQKAQLIDYTTQAS